MQTTQQSAVREANAEYAGSRVRKRFEDGKFYQGIVKKAWWCSKEGAMNFRIGTPC
jgi:hypothetical protein